MGLSGISPWSLLLVLLIVVLLFGTKRMRTLGSDLGEALKGFKKGMSDASDIDSTLKDELSAKESSHDSKSKDAKQP